MIYSSSKNLFIKNHLVYTYYISLAEAIIRHQKLCLTYKVSSSSCTDVKVTGNHQAIKV